MQASAPELDALASNMVVVATYWLSFEYAREPRHFNDPATASAALARGAYHVLALVAPFLQPTSRALLSKLAQSYL